MKIAIVHDWLTGLRGGERCLQAFLALYPEADVFTLLHVKGATAPQIDLRVKQSSFFQYLPMARRYYRLLLPLYPWAARSFDFSGYNLVLSLSHAAAKNVSVPKAIPHVSYCFSPMRYIWDQSQAYFGRALPLLWPFIKSLRNWDLAGAHGVDEFVAISNFVAARIRCYYRKGAEVIYPPVDSSWIVPRLEGAPGQAFLYAGALVPYKRVDLVVKAFNNLGLPLWIVGQGSEKAKLKRMARANITFIDRVADRELAQYYQTCRALIFPGTEDFGMIPVECMAAGRPVIGTSCGGLAESVVGARPWVDKAAPVSARATGVFMDPYNSDLAEALEQAVHFFVEHEAEFSSSACVAQAQRFSPQRFVADWESFLRRRGLAAFLPTQVESAYAQAKTAVV